MRVLITGATRGIGAALAQAYRARGDEVIGTSRTAQDGFWPLDVADPAAFDGLAGRLQGQRLDLLVCNAGIYNSKGLGLDALDAPLWAESFAINVTGAFLTVRACLPALHRGRGRIALIGSAMGSDQRAPGGSYIYRASKAALLNLGRNLAADLDLAVGIYHPGWVRTDMGGPDGDISEAESVAGLIARFDELDATRSGQFLAYDGSPIPF